MIVSSVLLALAIVAPKDGATVPTLREGQKAYLEEKRTERFIRMDNPADRAKLFAFGATQKPLKLEWSGDTNAVYILTVTADGGKDEVFSLTNRTNAYITNLELGKAYRWAVRQEGTENSDSATFTTEDEPPRLLRAGGVSNFRDLGGWRTADGKRVCENMIFRSAGLRSSSKSTGSFLRRTIMLGDRRVTADGIAALRDDFRIKTDLELRTPQETAGMNGTLLGTNGSWRCISFAAYDFIDNSVRGREPFAKIFEIFTKEENYPVLMHCSGGRDRTGTLAFLLNGLLGVDEDDLCRDWETSVFSDPGMKFRSDNILRLLDYLKMMPGETFRARVESYVKGCGVSEAEIAVFRSIMLKDGN
ncbi:MAG: tyrosine-protein phosphatase [bacterium]|nr:tyrosine-protein phosphatase [Candidatus Colisoma equi]